MLIIYSLLFTTCLIFITIEHPLMTMLTLILFSLVTSLITGTLLSSFWFSYMLFLIMVGGMLIIFVYMTSVASNEKFMVKYKFYNLIFLAPLLSMYMYINYKNYNNSTNLKIDSYQFMITKFFMFPYFMMIILLIVYLLITLIAVVKITRFNMGPLRQKY
uniref:NADH-ubiquinone oxidoreductase chain 6 n=1 Tax=Coleoptera sp. ACP-2013 TaxID=2485033 RepID=A0A3G3MEK8_9COLE|nr:NADH dehydrogenase subunit 6 [Coleoptera sp. ACP-2013]